MVFDSIGHTEPVAVCCIHCQWRRNGISAHLQKMIPHPGRSSLLGPVCWPPALHCAANRHLFCPRKTFDLRAKALDCQINGEKGDNYTLIQQNCVCTVLFLSPRTRSGRREAKRSAIHSTAYHFGATHFRLVTTQSECHSKYDTCYDPLWDHYASECSCSAEMLIVDSMQLCVEQFMNAKTATQSVSQVGFKCIKCHLWVIV